MITIRLLIPLDVSPERYEKVIRILFIKNTKPNSHYCVITDMSKFVGSQVNEHEHKIFVCDCCLNYFGPQKLLNEHLEYCNKHDVVNTT